MTAKKIFSVAYNGDFVPYMKEVVEKYHEHIAEVYFPLPADVLPNARGSNEIMNTKHIMDLCFCLQKFNIRPVGLFNSVWTPIEVYSNEYMSYALDRIEELFDAGMTKLIVNNYYLISTGIIKNSIKGLEITASINSRHDTPDKVLAHVAFNSPTHVYLDRSFNRKLTEFDNVVASLNELGIESSVLVNEGCLYNCPFKTDHDNQISMASYGGHDFLNYSARIASNYPKINENLSRLNIDSGCGRVYKTNPWYLLKSPFIRPEDLDRYLGGATYAKIAGRNRSTEWIANVVKAYVDRSYDGSIVDLIDVADVDTIAPEPFANKKLGGLLKLNGDCHKVCMSCGKCKKYFDEVCLGGESSQLTIDDIAPVDAQIRANIEKLNESEANKNGNGNSD